MNQWIIKGKAGIENYFHPLFNNHTFYIPERRSRIFIENDDVASSITCSSNQHEEQFCAFCLGLLNQATPEKLRAIRYKEQIKFIPYPGLDNNPKHEVLFRRQGNLFEILSYNYWKECYGIKLSEADQERLDNDFNSPKRYEYLEDLLRIKSFKMGIDSELLSIVEKKNFCESFYGGFHELLTAGSHYLPYAKKSSDLFHSGYIPYQDHRISYHMLCSIIQDMHQKNPYIKFVAVFQNWLSNAGASFEHWHKQILGLDYWGLPLEREATFTKQNPNFYKDFINDSSIKHDLIIAENEHAIAYIEIGAKTGQISICSKSKNLRPYEHSAKEINSMSDLSHAILQSFSSLTPYNEEWYYTPIDSTEFRTPWRIIINIRTNTVAGLEHISQIAINPISAKELAYTIRLRLEATKEISPTIIINPKGISKNIFLYNN